MGRRDVSHERREQILMGLFQSMVAKGFYKCSVTDIAREARLSRGTLHYYFKNKDEMLIELMERLGEAHYQGILMALQGGKDPEEKLRRVVRFHHLDVSKPMYDMVGIWIEFWGQIPHNKAIRDVFCNIQGRLRDLLSRLIAEGVESGIFRPVDPQAAASVVLGMVEGPTLQWRVDRKSVSPEQTGALAEEMLIHYLRNGIAAERNPNTIHSKENHEYHH